MALKRRIAKKIASYYPHLPPVEEITLLSDELTTLWKEWDAEKKYGSHVDCYVWWHQNGARINQIQSRVNKLRIIHSIPCVRKGGKHRVFYPFIVES